MSKGLMDLYEYSWADTAIPEDRSIRLCRTESVYKANLYLRSEPTAMAHDQSSAVAALYPGKTSPMGTRPNVNRCAAIARTVLKRSRNVPEPNTSNVHWKPLTDKYLSQCIISSFLRALCALEGEQMLGSVDTRWASVSLVFLVPQP